MEDIIVFYLVNSKILSISYLVGIFFCNLFLYFDNVCTVLNENMILLKIMSWKLINGFK